MNRLNERYSDVMGDGTDPALTRLVADLDAYYTSQPPPLHRDSAITHALKEQMKLHGTLVTMPAPGRTGSSVRGTYAPRRLSWVALAMVAALPLLLLTTLLVVRGRAPSTTTQPGTHPPVVGIVHAAATYPLRSIAVLHGHTDLVNYVTFSPDGKTLASGSNDSTIRLWNVATHRQIGQPLSGSTGWVWWLAFSPDGKTLASGDNGTVRLWNVATHRQIDPPITGDTGNVASVAFSPDGKTLASGSDDGTLRFWSVATHRQIGVSITGPWAAVWAVAFSPDGKTLASGTGLGEAAAPGAGPGAIQLWDVATHRLIGRPLTGHTDAVVDVAFSPDGKSLVSSSFDGTVRLWDVTTHRQVGRPLTGGGLVALSPNGTILASALFTKIQLLNLATRQQIGPSLTAGQPGPPGTGQNGWVGSIAFSPDGKLLASCSNTTIQLWALHG
jgi:WD40 repeat protein